MTTIEPRIEMVLQRGRPQDRFWLGPWRLHRLPLGRRQWLRLEEVYPGHVFAVVHGPVLHGPVL